MRSFARLFPILTFVLAAASPARAGVDLWTGHSPGGSIAAVAVDPANPDRLYAAGENGIFKSEDGGASWTWIDPANAALHKARCLAIDPSHAQRIYAGTGDTYSGGHSGQLLRSEDGGAHWSSTDLRTSASGEPKKTR
jgi:photosystem II stability/assembly factor-like uncharacterized protein